MMGCSCNSNLETRFSDLTRKVDALTDAMLRLTTKLCDLDAERQILDRRIDALEVEVCR